ncbi:porin [Rhodovulum sp. DZ06]|uniref:porin n=1 Tax=Rhodovulum sp. DZ06 TaxID=3425126 RepID=UPI003D330BDB
MKNALFATTALVALGVAGAASAAEPLTASVSGYMFAGVAYSTMDNGVTSSDDVGVMRDGEIHFSFRGTSDNGLTFDGRVELEAFTTGDTIDENWVRISGPFGWVKIGADDHASYNLSTGVLYAPGAKIGHYDAFNESHPVGGVFATNNRFSDQVGIHYNTPEFSGLQAQISYLPSLSSDSGGDSNTAVFGDDDAISLGVNYRFEGEGFAVQVSGGYDVYDAAAGLDDDGFSAGARVEVAGFTLGGLYKEGMEDSLAGNHAESEYVVNAAYSTGPWTAGLGWAHFSDLGGTTTDADKFAGWVTYALMPGVTTTLGVEHTNVDGGGADADGTTAMLYMGLSF